MTAVIVLAAIDMVAEVLTTVITAVIETAVAIILAATEGVLRQIQQLLQLP